MSNYNNWWVVVVKLFLQSISIDTNCTHKLHPQINPQITHKNYTHKLHPQDTNYTYMYVSQYGSIINIKCESLIPHRIDGLVDDFGLEDEVLVKGYLHEGVW